MMANQENILVMEDVVAAIPGGRFGGRGYFERACQYSKEVDHTRNNH